MRSHARGALATGRFAAPKAAVFEGLHDALNDGGAEVDSVEGMNVVASGGPSRANVGFTSKSSIAPAAVGQGCEVVLPGVLLVGTRGCKFVFTATGETSASENSGCLPRLFHANRTFFAAN